MPDPPIPADGRCVVCHGTRKMPDRKLHREVAQADPFCSSECARAFYGVSLPSSKYAEKPKPIVMHGTERGYNAYKCRCAACVEASRAARQHRRERERA